MFGCFKKKKEEEKQEVLDPLTEEEEKWFKDLLADLHNEEQWKKVNRCISRYENGKYRDFVIGGFQNRNILFLYSLIRDLKKNHTTQL